MNKSEFTQELAERLKSLPQSEIDSAISYYSESIDDRIESGMTEAEAVSALGNDIGAIAESVMYDMPLSTLVKAKVSERTNKTANKGLWILLAILGFPVWLPLILAFAIVILTIYITIGALIISVYAVVLSVGLAGIVALISGIVFCFTSSLPVGICTIGSDFVL